MHHPKITQHCAKCNSSQQPVSQQQFKHTDTWQNCTYGGIMGVVPSMVTSFAMSRTAMMEGVETDFWSGSLVGNSLRLSASLFVTTLLKSFCKLRAQLQYSNNDQPLSCHKK